MNTLVAHELALQAITLVRPIIEKVARHDPDLARQMRRAASSAPSNLAEGNRRQGRDRQHLFSVALGSADELKTQLRVAHAWGYAPEKELAPAVEIVDRVCATTHRLLYPRR
jgi:four helix bundle protein